MQKYYVIDVFLIERLEKFKYCDCIHEQQAKKLIVTKTFGGFEEIKTGRFIPNLPKSGAKVQYNGYISRDKFKFSLPLALKKDVLTNGAILIAISESIDFLGDVVYYPHNPVHETIRPVKDIEEVREYLNGNTAEELFEKLDNIRRENLLDYSAEKRNARKVSVEKKIKGWSKKIQTYAEKKQEEKKLTIDINEEIKKRK